MKFFIILFISFIVNILCNSNNYQIYYKSQLRNLFEEKQNKIYTNINKLQFSVFCCPNENTENFNITSLISSILIKIKNIFLDIDITIQPFKNIIINHNRLLCDDDINNIYTLFW
jgi:hypothetical protein